MRRSLVTTILVLAALGNLAFNFWSLVSDERYFRLDVLKQTAARVQKQFQGLGLQDPELAQQLHSLVDREKIGFYRVSSFGRSPASDGHMRDYSENVAADFQPVLDGQVRTVLSPEDQHPIAVYVGQRIGDREVFVGQSIDHQFIEKVAAYNKASFWSLVLGNFLVVAVVILYGLHDLLKLFRNVRERGIAGFKSLSNEYSQKESYAFAQALHQASKERGESHTAIEDLRRLILPSLLSEYSEKRDLPYEFQAILMRVDINNSTQVYKNPNLRFVQDHWFEYFKIQAAAIATRYGGLAHEELGDQIILYFKETLGKGYSEYALACARDVMLLSQEIRKAIGPEFVFTIKGSMDQGLLRAYKSVLDPAGPGRVKICGVGSQTSQNIFVTTDRLMKLVEDRSRDSFFCTSRVPLAGSGVVLSSIEVLRDIPGFELGAKVSEINSFKPFILELDKAPERLLFADDESVAKILLHIESIALNAKSELEAQKWITLLRLGHFANPGPILQKQWVELLKRWASGQHFENVVGSLSASLIALTPQFIKNKSFSEQLRKEVEPILQKFMRHPHPRVQANAIEAWSALSAQFEVLNQPWNEFKGNRALANALIHTLNQALDDASLSRLSKMLSHKDAAMRAAGCFAVGRVREHYLAHDSVVLKTNERFMALVTKAQALRTDSNEMVQRQAMKVS